MLSQRSGDPLEDSAHAAWRWGAVAAVVCDILVVSMLAIARSRVFHGISFSQMGFSAVSKLRSSAMRVTESMSRGRYPISSSGAAATALLLAAAAAPVLSGKHMQGGVQLPAAAHQQRQQLSWRQRRQCTLVSLCILSMAQLSSLACSNWAAAYAAAVVCVPLCMLVCQLLK